MDITVDIRVYISIIVLLSRVSSSLEQSSSSTLKDPGEGYLELLSRIGVSIRWRSIVDLTSDLWVEEVQDCSLNNGESLEDPWRASVLVNCILGTLTDETTLGGVP